MSDRDDRVGIIFISDEQSKELIELLRLLLQTIPPALTNQSQSSIAELRGVLHNLLNFVNRSEFPIVDKAVLQSSLELTITNSEATVPSGVGLITNLGQLLDSLLATVLLLKITRNIKDEMVELIREIERKLSFILPTVALNSLGNGGATGSAGPWVQPAPLAQLVKRVFQVL